MNKLPPDPEHAVLRRIYPWDEYDKNLILAWLYIQATNTGFIGSFEDFKLRYGIYNLEKYMGATNIIPKPYLEIILNTKDTIVTDDIIIQPIPYREEANEFGTTVIIG